MGGVRMTLSAKQVEIYALVDPRTGNTRYIGKANCAAKRLKSHIRDARRRDTPVYRWFRKLARMELVPEVVILERVDEKSWAERECHHISSHTGARLLNVAPGGDQPFPSVETRAANGRRVSRMIHDNPLRRRIWQLKRGIGESHKRGWLTDNAKRKLRQAAATCPEMFGEYAAV